MAFLRLAWRNAWRNKRRTGILVTAVAVGIAGTLLTMALNFGMVFQMVELAIESDLGHVQVHATGWDANPELALLLADGGARALGTLEADPRVRAVARRVRGEGLLASPRASAGVRVLGIETDRESKITRIASSVTEGSYLDTKRRRVLIGAELARRLEVDVGDKVVLSAQDLEGELAGEALRVVGLFEAAAQGLERGTVYIPLSEAQGLLGLGSAVSEVVAVARDRDDVDDLRDRIASALPDREVRSWSQLQPLLLYIVDIFDQSALLVYAAVFIAMAFGIANVLLMTVYERTREIGVMRAIGLSRRRLVANIVAEAVVVTAVGLLAGFGLAGLGTLAMGDGVDLSAFADGLRFVGVGSRIQPVLRSQDFTGPTLVALVTAVVASAWPAWRAARLKPAEAVRQT
jgi:ABC-type lipoprotein release transport system permease subunit